MAHHFTEALMPSSYESVLSTCTPRTIASLRARAGINMAPSVSVEAQARAVAEWCLENDITPQELWALSDCAAWHQDGPRVSTYTEQAPGYAAALTTLSRALGEGDAIDALGKARAFVASVSAELLAFRKAERNRGREQERAPQPGPDAAPTLLGYLRAIPLEWQLIDASPELAYSASEGRLSIQVYQGQHGINSAHVAIAELGSDCVGFEAVDEAPFIIRHLIGKIALNNLNRMTVDEVKACVPPWAQHHVHRQIEEEVTVFRRSHAHLERAALGLQADSDKRLALAERLKAEWCGGAK
jgi:hypothetical protein